MKYKKLLTNFFKKPLSAQIILLIALAGIFSYFKPYFKFSNNPPPQSESKADNTANLVTLAINFETEKRFFEGEAINNMTMLDALNAAVSVGKIKLNYAVDKANNVNIMELDGHINGLGNKYLVFYLNSKKIATKDLNKQAVRNGDGIEIRNE